MPTVLILDADPASRAVIHDGLPADCTVLECATTEAALAAADRAGGVDLAIADWQTPPGETRLLDALRARGITTVMTAAFSSIEDAVDAMRHGAVDFLGKPFTTDQIELTATRALDHAKLSRENETLREALDDRLRLENFVSADPRMHAVFKTARAVARARTTVLITGESGTGKTLLARAIHRASDRARAPFVEVNCGALPESLLESELFGHVRGSFTGAVKDRPGKFEAAAGGTIFLDEIGTSSPGFQVKLLRVLQDRVIERVGDTKTVPVDVRVVLATNADLAAAVRAGTFREDLYYRIHVVTIEVPPLRDRPGDVRLLAEHFLRRFADEAGKPLRGFTAGALDCLTTSAWPGNVRQLENVVERAVVLTEKECIDVDDLPPDLSHAPAGRGGPESMIRENSHLLPLRVALEEPERLIIQRALAHHGGNRQQTAKSLDINRSTLFNKMRKFGLL